MLTHPQFLYWTHHLIRTEISGAGLQLFPPRGQVTLPPTIPKAFTKGTAPCQKRQHGAHPPTSPTTPWPLLFLPNPPQRRRCKLKERPSLCRHGIRRSGSLWLSKRNLCTGSEHEKRVHEPQPPSTDQENKTAEHVKLILP